MKRGLEIIKIVVPSILGAIIGAFIYAIFFNPIEIIYNEQSQKAQLAAENEYH